MLSVLILFFCYLFNVLQRKSIFFIFDFIIILKISVFCVDSLRQKDSAVLFPLEWMCVCVSVCEFKARWNYFECLVI